MKKLLKKISSLFKVSNYGFPKKLENYWISGKIFGSGYRDTEYKLANKYNYKWEKGNIIPLLYKDGKIGIYKVVDWKMYGSGMGDYAGYDDRKEFELKFIKTIPVSIIKNKDGYDLVIDKQVIFIPNKWRKRLRREYISKSSEYYLETILQCLYCVKPEKLKN